MFGKITHLFNRHHAVQISDISSDSDSDSGTKPAGAAGKTRDPRTIQFAHDLPGKREWGPENFEVGNDLGNASAAAANRPAQADIGVQLQMAELFEARKTTAEGAIPLQEQAPETDLPDLPVRAYSDDRLTVMSNGDAQSNDVEFRKLRGVCLIKDLSGAAAQTYSLVQNGQEITDPAQLQTMLALLRSGLALPELPRQSEPPASSVERPHKVDAGALVSSNRQSRVEMEFQKEAGKVFANRYTDSPSALPLPFGRRSNSPPLVRELSEGGSSLCIHAPDQPMEQGLMMVQNMDGHFQLFREGRELTKRNERTSALHDIRRYLGMPETHRAPGHDSGRKRLTKQMTGMMKDMQLKVTPRMIRTAGGDKLFEVLDLKVPRSRRMAPHVVERDGIVLKWDRGINNLQFNGLSVLSVSDAMINSVAHNFLHRLDAAPLSETVRVTAKATRNGATETIETQFTGSQKIPGTEIVDGDGVRAPRRFQTLMHLVGATDVLDPDDNRQIMQNVVIDGRGVHQAIDIHDSKEPAGPPGRSLRSTRHILGMSKDQVAAELDRARAHAHRQLDKSSALYDRKDLVAIRHNVNTYVAECHVRLQAL